MLFCEEVYSRLPNKRTGYVYQFLNFFPGGTLLFEGVRLLDLKIFEDKIGISSRKLTDFNKKPYEYQHLIKLSIEGTFISGGCVY